MINTLLHLTTVSLINLHFYITFCFLRTSEIGHDNLIIRTGLRNNKSLLPLPQLSQNNFPMQVGTRIFSKLFQYFYVKEKLNIKVFTELQYFLDRSTLSNFNSLINYEKGGDKLISVEKCF